MKKINLQAHANRATRDKKAAIKHGYGGTSDYLRNNGKNHTSFSAKLVLSHPPLSNFEFAKMKEELEFRKFLENSMIYVIVQRSELTFENIKISTEFLNFELKRKGFNSILSCTVPIKQKAITEEEKPIKYYYLDHGNVGTSIGTDVKAIQLNDLTDNVLLTITPDFFLWAYNHKLLDADIEGDIRSFTEYKVCYVGKATDLTVCERLSPHGTLQDIISKERSINSGSLPTDEVMLLLFEVQEKKVITVSPSGDSLNDTLKALISGNVPTNKTIALDAEKAFVKCLNPRYNKIKYKTYPKRKDVAYQFGYDKLSYTVAENLELQSDSGSIVGGIVPGKGDLLVVRYGKISVIKRYGLNI